MDIIKDSDDPFVSEYAVSWPIDSLRVLVHADRVQDKGLDDYAAALRLLVGKDNFPLRIKPVTGGYLTPYNWCWSFIEGSLLVPKSFRLFPEMRTRMREHAMSNNIPYLEFNQRLYFEDFHAAVMTFASC